MSEQEHKPEETAAQPVPVESTGEAAQSAETSPQEPATKPKSKAATKTGKTSKTDAVSVLKSVGLEMCKLHKLPHVWVTDDGQCFPVEGDAKAHAVNLKNKDIVKVKAE